ncbi:MAG: type II toxin-antitoxin system HicB family antitoxin [Anaerolineae bacterium]|nr:type II toxin-antitoxin system HicB family antitoxin [Anaerolineae bacterium]MCO5205656.1 type II toxin-antitoxin system HicB family antitoxin [Anaerolineae bacterium]
MRRFTLRLPETLFHRLEMLADSEGVSLNQYLVYALTQTVARVYQPEPLSQAEIARQHAQYDALMTSLGTVSDAEFERILAEGEPGGDDMRLDPETAARVAAKIEAARQVKAN